MVDSKEEMSILLADEAMERLALPRHACPTWPALNYLFLAG